jgi:hypothetical protein
LIKARPTIVLVAHMRARIDLFEHKVDEKSPNSYNVDERQVCFQSANGQCILAIIAQFQHADTTTTLEFNWMLCFKVAIRFLRKEEDFKGEVEIINSRTTKPCPKRASKLIWRARSPFSQSSARMI